MGLRCSTLLQSDYTGNPVTKYYIGGFLGVFCLVFFFVLFYFWGVFVFGGVCVGFFCFVLFLLDAERYSVTPSSDT